MRTNTLHRIVALAVIGMTAAGCQDEMDPTAMKPAVELPAPPALGAAQAARAGVVLEDALTRLVPAAGAEMSPLGMSLQELTAMLGTGDVISLNRQIARTHLALDAQPMASADTDALRMALAWVSDAVSGAHADALN